MLSTFARSLSQSYKPRCDIYKSTKQFIIEFDLPGVKKDEISIDLADDSLKVTATRNFPYPDDYKALRQERTFGKFERSFNLPKNIDTSNIDAAYLDGVLKISIPQCAPKKNSIRIGLKD